MTYLTSIVEDAWNAAVAAKDYQQWSSLESMARNLADSLYKRDPDDISALTHRAIAQEASRRMLAMEPARETA